VTGSLVRLCVCVCGGRCLFSWDVKVAVWEALASFFSFFSCGCAFENACERGCRALSRFLNLFFFLINCLYILM